MPPGTHWMRQRKLSCCRFARTKHLTTMKPKRKPTMRSILLVPFAAIFVLLGIASANAGYPELILPNNPAAYYRLEELPGATIAVDSSPNHFDATYVYNSGSSSPALGNPGIATNSAGFNGGTTADKGFVLIPYHSELNPQMPDLQHGAPFSVECWVQATTQPPAYSVPLASFGHYNDPAPFGNASGWNIYQTPGPNSSWIFNLKTVGFFNWTGAIELLKWYHLVFTFDGSAGYFYINGVEASSLGGITAYLANPSYNGQIAAGDNVGFLPFVGGVDEVAFYTNALSLATVVADYQLGTNSLRAVPTPPGFLQQPSSRTNFHGTTASFSTVVSGTQPVTYQWYRGASPIPNATNRDYSLTAKYPADDGATFSVAVTNIVSGTNSAVATLTVLTNLDILNQPYGPITRNVGSKAAFRVVATGAVPITYEWYEVKAGVTNLIPNATSDTLWLSSVQLLDDQSGLVRGRWSLHQRDGSNVALPRSCNRDEEVLPPPGAAVINRWKAFPSAARLRRFSQRTSSKTPSRR
jgi:Concanavalin A-like lectin/glucanases superfamily